MAGIYLHIPFCKRACHYCNFHFSTQLQNKEALVAALEREVVLQKSYLNTQTIGTIYFGGGTPSLLTYTELEQLLKVIRANYNVMPDAEVTLEANPDDINETVLQQWLQIGINRLSVGVQSFWDDELQWMNRAHGADAAHGCIQKIKAAPFTNYSIDLIYGSPLLDDQRWQHNVETAVNYGVPHLSGYALTVEEKTALHHFIQQKQMPPIAEEKAAQQFLLLMNWLKDAGYEHYEVSNWALPGNHSRHNSSYWGGTHYLGIGPSAHSFNGATRQWNAANNSAYINSIEKGIVPFTMEELTTANRLNEHLMIRLRTAAGLNMAGLRTLATAAQQNAINAQIKKYAQQGLLRIHNNTVQLTQQGMLQADGIAAGLFV